MKILIRTICLLFVFISMRAVAEVQAILNGMSIIGNEESPKILYLVPWQSSEIADIEELVISSRLFDETLVSIDRETLIRKELYRQAKQKIYNR